MLIIFQLGNLKGRDRLGLIDVYERIILKWLLKVMDCVHCIQLLRMRFIVRLS
jgi:hypothetical protein